MRRFLTALALLAALAPAADAQFLSPAERGRPLHPPIVSSSSVVAVRTPTFAVWNNNNFISGAGGNPQFLHLYNSVDNPLNPINYQRLTISWNDIINSVAIGAEWNGTGGSQGLRLFTGQTPTTAGGSLNINNGGVISVQTNTGLFSLVGNGTGWTAGWSVPSPNVLQANDGSFSANSNGWINWAGEARLDADFSATSNTTLANVTGTTHSLTVNLQATRKYIFDIELMMVTGASAGGIKIGLGGTATITNLIADGMCIDGPTAALIGTTQVSTLTQIVANTNAGTTPKCSIHGTFESNAAGTFTTQFAQNASSATASTVKRGSYMMVHDSP